ncbi:MAG: hypothetical protein QXD48_03265 [Candidatus Aenigmatarchaeota archaeon]
MYSKELIIGDNKINVEIHMNNKKNEYVSEFILKSLEYLSKSEEKFVFPNHDTNIIFEFGTDEKIYDCIMCVNLDRSKDNTFIIESNINRVIKELTKNKYKKYKFNKTDLFNIIKHEIQHIKNGDEMKDFFNKIDIAQEYKKITKNEFWQALTFSDLKYEGIAETIENGCKILEIKNKNIIWFRKKFDMLSKTKEEKLEDFYENFVRMEHSKGNIHDNYTNGRYVFYFLTAAMDDDTEIFDIYKLSINKKFISSELEDNGIIYIHPKENTFIEAYELIDSIDIKDFIKIYENMNNILGIPISLQAVDIQKVKEIFSKIYDK